MFAAVAIAVVTLDDRYCLAGEKVVPEFPERVADQCKYHPDSIVDWQGLQAGVLAHLAHDHH